MAEYIEREAALDCVKCDLGKKDYKISYQGAMVEIAFRIDAIPAADVVPVVRCKDCRYCLKEDEWELWCMSASPACLTAPDDYCSRGRENDVEG